jgi:hypothetical protein
VLDLDAPTTKVFQAVALEGGEILAYGAGFLARLYGADGAALRLPDDTAEIVYALRLGDGSVLAAGHESTWRLGPGGSAERVAPQAVFASEVAPGRVALGAASGAIGLWGPESGYIALGGLRAPATFAHLTPAGDLVMGHAVFVGPERRRVDYEGTFLAALGGGSILVMRDRITYRLARGEARGRRVPALDPAKGSAAIRHALCLEGGLALVWDAFDPVVVVLDAQGEVHERLEGHRGGIKGAWPLGGGRYVIADGGARLRIWSPSPEPRVGTKAREAPRAIESESVYPLGEAGFITMTDGGDEAQTWDADGRWLATVPIIGWGHKGGWGWYLLPLSTGTVLTWPDGRLRLVRPDGRLARDLGAHPGGVAFALELRDGRFLVAGAEQPVIRIWSPAGEFVVELRIPNSTRVFDAAEFADGRIVALGSVLSFWDADGGGQRTVPAHGHSRLMVLRPDRFALGSYDPEVVVIDGDGLIMESFRSTLRFRDERVREHEALGASVQGDVPVLRMMSGAYDGLKATPRRRTLELADSDGVARWEALYEVWRPVSVVSRNRAACIAGHELHVLARMNGAAMTMATDGRRVAPVADPNGNGYGGGLLRRLRRLLSGD